MALMKCKMCGGDLEIEEGMSVAVCEYCGTKQTIPTLDNERKASLFGRAGRLLRACEFDKASVVFGDIVSEFPEEAEGYWGLLLCKYGVEYVDDPATGKKIPTCHRLSFENIMEDSDFEQALENADSVARSVYREEAKFLENLRRSVIEVSSKEEPYDVFICYKETAADGGRTVDSVMAQDIYDALTDKGLRVFFARITLEDKLGMEYEPYIFAALNSAKVMLAIGTDYEYFNAVWVKNEWSRFLKLIAKGEKKVLIPCYKDIDAYDMPAEFKNLQAQDMGKLGFMQDLVRGVCKILGVGEKKEAVVEKTVVKETVVSESTSKASSLLERAFIFLEDGKWKDADSYAEKVLDIEPKNAMAYLCKLCAELRVDSVEKLSDSDINFQEKDNFKKAVRFADNELKEKLEIQNNKAKENQKKVKQHYISADLHTVGVKSDGTVVAAGLNKDGQCDVQNWKNIVAVYTGYRRTIGLKSDGTVVAAGNNFDCQCDVDDWDNIVAVSAGYEHTIGLKSNGTVVAVGNNTDGQCDVDDWDNIVAVSAGDEHTVGLKSNGTVVAVGKNEDGQCDVENWENVVAVSAKGSYTVGLKSNGTVVAVGGNYNCECDVEGWKKIVAICAGSGHTVGLKSDGTVVDVGFDEDGQCDVENWKNIQVPLGEKEYKAKLQRMREEREIEIKKEKEEREAKELIQKELFPQKFAESVFKYKQQFISAGSCHTVGVKSDGTVVAVGDNSSGECNVSNWKNIVAVSAYSHTIGLKSDGTVVAVGNNEDGQCDVDDWKNIVAISARYHTVGLKSNGTVVAVGDNENGQCEVSDWKNIVAVSAGGSYTVGLKSDGTVVAVGDNKDGQCDVEDWKNIIAVSAGYNYTVGLRTDGTVVAVGYNYKGQCNVFGWKNIAAISAGSFHTVGIKFDGMVVSTGENDYGECNVSGWRYIDVPRGEEEYAAIKAKREAAAAAEKARMETERKARIESLEKEKTDLEAEVPLLIKEKVNLGSELANLKGLFTGKRKKEINTRLAEIDVRIKSIDTWVNQINNDLSFLKNAGVN